MQNYKNLVVNEADGYARYDLLDRTGDLIAMDVMMVVSSPILQQGTPWGAREANTLLALDDGGQPVLALDGGTY